MRTLTRFYKLYRHGRINKKAPQGYIDYFDASHFLIKELDGVEKEVIAMLRYSKHNPPVDCDVEEIFKKLKGKNK